VITFTAHDESQYIQPDQSLDGFGFVFYGPFYPENNITMRAVNTLDETSEPLSFIE
jgi:hypothetical protein